MDNVAVRELSLGEMRLAGALLGRAMRDNPLHIRVVGPDPARREAAFGGIFGVLLASLHLRGTVLGAELNGRLVGVCALVPPGKCEPSGREQLTLVRTVLQHTSLGVTFNALRWLGSWAKHDPRDPHWHLGPIGVERNWQGQGIGSALLRAYGERVDRNQGLGYLETDKVENLRFYERFGFKTMAEDKVLGVPNWFMLRAVVRKGASQAAEPGAG